jgi:hypothetical protein
MVHPTSPSVHLTYSPKNFVTFLVSDVYEFIYGSRNVNSVTQIIASSGIVIT